MAPKAVNAFWKAVKPFLSKKGTISTGDLTLIENITLVPDPVKVVNIMNDFYIHIADHIGTENKDENLDEHSSVIKIKTQVINNSFSFKKVTEENVLGAIKRLDADKATGYDHIPPKPVKMAGPTITPVLTNLINKSSSINYFPEELFIKRMTG